MPGREPKTSSLPADRTRFYRPELDALRFLAFLLVFVEHMLRKASLGAVAGHPLTGPMLLLSRSISLVGEVGNFGMCLFFLLSAFLITELLLLERDRTGSIDILAFYVRRILRIWPLYFGFLAFCYFLGQVGPPAYLVSGRQVAAYLLLSGNWYLIFGGVGPSWLLILWSISVEEQFYLLWPGIVKAGKGQPGVRAGILLFALVSVAAMFWLGRSGGVNQEVVWFNSCIQFLFFALGAALALAVHKRGTPQISPPLRLLVLLFAFAIWATAEAGFGLRVQAEQLTTARILAGYGLLALGTVLVFTAFLGVSPQKVPAWLRTLGKVSYGLYVFHDLCLSETENLLGLLAHHLQLHGAPLAALKLSVGPLAMATTIAIALLSYRFFESPFLRMRQKFTLVPSRPV